MVHEREHAACGPRRRRVTQLCCQFEEQRVRAAAQQPRQRTDAHQSAEAQAVANMRYSGGTQRQCEDLHQTAGLSQPAGRTPTAARHRVYREESGRAYAQRNNGELQTGAQHRVVSGETHGDAARHAGEGIDRAKHARLAYVILM